MEKEIKLIRGWSLTKYDNGNILVCDTELNMFIHADSGKINNDESDKTWLNLKVGDKHVASVWLTTKALIKRTQKLLEE